MIWKKFDNALWKQCSVDTSVIVLLVELDGV